MRLFDVLGPVMTGPSSSHTAGAVRIGSTARRLLGEQPAQAEIHSTAALPPPAAAMARDRAPRGRSFWACSSMMTASPTASPWPRPAACTIKSAPSTPARRPSQHGGMRLVGVSGRKLEVVGASIGGGRINICQIDGITTNFGGDHNTLIVHNQDTPGVTWPPCPSA